jgi:hypothetical protein
MQWGYSSNVSEGPVEITYPIAFPNAVFVINVTPFADGKRSGAVYNPNYNGQNTLPAPTTTTAWMGAGEGSHSSWEWVPFYWTALGN